MTVLHELIAIEGDKLETTKQMLAEAITTFNKRTEHFRAENKILRMLDEDRNFENMSTSGEIVTTVDEKLKHVWKSVTKAIDATACKDMTNTLARADIVIEGDSVASGVPAIVLLSLETTLGKIRNMYNSIPTLDPAIDWVLDENTGRAIFKSGTVRTHKTEKKVDVISMAKATKEHPEQVQAINKDVIVGTYDTVKRSGMLTPREKAERLSRISVLISAVKQARQRANMQEIKELDLGKFVEKFIEG